MATNLAIDDAFLERARRIGKLRTKKETVTQALIRVHPASEATGYLEGPRDYRDSRGVGLQERPTQP